MQNPRQYKIPDWFLNRQKDVVDGKFSQVSKPKFICVLILNISLLFYFFYVLVFIFVFLNIFSLPPVPLTANYVKIWKG